MRSESLWRIAVVVKQSNPHTCKTQTQLACTHQLALVARPEMHEVQALHLRAVQHLACNLSSSHAPLVHSLSYPHVPEQTNRDMFAHGSVEAVREVCCKRVIGHAKHVSQ